MPKKALVAFIIIIALICTGILGAMSYHVPSDEPLPTVTDVTLNTAADWTGLNCVVTDDPTHYIAGNASVKSTINETYQDVKLYLTFPQPLNYAVPMNESIRLCIYSDWEVPGSGANKFAVFLSDTDGNEIAQTVQSEKVGKWNVHAEAPIGVNAAKSPRGSGLGLGWYYISNSTAFNWKVQHIGILVHAEHAIEGKSLWIDGLAIP
jgi:hypothetical protein